jgi:hypothetical protein
MSETGRIGCSKCNWRGYQKHAFWNGEKEEVTVSVCSHCKDIRGYNNYIKSKYSKVTNIHLIKGEESKADIIDLDYYKNNKSLKYIEDEEEINKLAEKQFLEFGEIPKIN